VIGIWLDAPETSVTDAANRGLDALASGRVLIIEVDGLGFSAYREYAQSGCNNLKRFKAVAARTVMPSISNVALASIVTGKTPDQTGVLERKDRELKVPDIFFSAASADKTCAVVEGYSTLISMSAEQTLNADANGNGYTDDEVQKSALLAVDSGVDLIYVHYHGLDDAGHEHGPSSPEAAEKMKEIDGYIGELLSRYSGTVILISDHGMHKVDLADASGMHGTFVPLDMTVPMGILSIR